MSPYDDKHLAQIRKRLKTSSAVVPSLIFSLIAIPTASAGMILGSETTRPMFMVLLLVPVVLTAGQILFFTIFDRDRLQNEEHVERKMLLTRMKPEIGDAHSTVEIDADGKIVNNPTLGGPDV
jgi:hypothetical protein